MFDLRVLYAEDEEQIRNIFERILGKLTKEVYVATNGEEALGLYYEKNPDIIITDVKMPRMTGFEMAAEVRKKDKLIPIVAITAHNETEHFLEAIRLGVTNFLVKPIELEQLKEALVMVGEIVNLQRDNRQKTALLEQYKSAVDAANIVSKADKNGIITYVNELFCNVSGYSKDEIIGKKVFDFEVGEDIDVVAGGDRGGGIDDGLIHDPQLVIADGPAQLRQDVEEHLRGGVEQRPVPRGRQQAAIVVLAVNFDEVAADFAQQRRLDPVDAGLAAQVFAQAAAAAPSRRQASRSGMSG